jgi:hypothetical protein
MHQFVWVQYRLLLLMLVLGTKCLQNSTGVGSLSRQRPPHVQRVVDFEQFDHTSEKHVLVVASQILANLRRGTLREHIYA